MYRFIEISSYNIRRHALPARQSVSFRRMVKNRIADYRTFSPMVSSQILIVSFNNVIANSLHNLFDNRLYKKSTVIPSKLRWICVVWQMTQILIQMHPLLGLGGALLLKGVHFSQRGCRQCKEVHLRKLTTVQPFSDPGNQLLRRWHFTFARDLRPHSTS